MNFDWLKAKQTKYTGYVTLYIAVVLTVLGVVNYLANRHTQSWDATANKRYSLSDQTHKIATNLKQDVKITYFDRSSNFRNGRELLDRYTRLSSKIAVEYVDPDKNPVVARAAGVSSYGSTFVQVAAKREEAKSMSEEEVTGAIIRAIKEGERTVCALQGLGEHGLDESERSGYSNLKEYIERNNYKVREIRIPQTTDIPADCTILMAGGPTRDYPQPLVDSIQKYVEGGGRGLFLLDPPVSFQGSEVDENPALAKVLEEWGVKLNKDVVLDPNPMGQLFGFNAATPLVQDYEFHAIVREMRGSTTIFPFTRSLEVLTGKKATVEKLFSSTDSAFTATDLSRQELKADKKGSFVLAAAGTMPGADKQEGRFVVAGTSGWVDNRFLRQGGNRDLVMNMLNWLSQDEDLISIRPKEPENRPLSMTRAQMSLVFYFSVIGLPVLVIAAGIGVWWKRR
jgi:ABC-type uncharacterized transport system involved in gliding motility auxiliary subunit